MTSKSSPYKRQKSLTQPENHEAEKSLKPMPNIEPTWKSPHNKKKKKNGKFGIL